MMKDSMEQDQKITRELGRYRLADSSRGLHDRVLRAAEEAWAGGTAERHWTGQWLGACHAFRQEILAFASVLLLILGTGMRFAGVQSVLADSIERVTLMAALSESLSRATSVDCMVIRRGAGNEHSRYRVRWDSGGVTRVDLYSIHGPARTLWISHGSVWATDSKTGPPRPTTDAAMPYEWQPPKEFLTPKVLARQLEGYGLLRARRQEGAQPAELRFSGQDGPQVVELSLDAKTGLPKTLRKYLPASALMGEERPCSEEVRFRWNEPIGRELLVPGLPSVKPQVR